MSPILQPIFLHWTINLYDTCIQKDLSKASGKRVHWFLIFNSFNRYWALWIEQRYFPLQTLRLSVASQCYINVRWIGVMLAKFFSSLILSTPTSKSGRQEFGTLSAFCGQSCPLQLLHKSAKEILCILRNRVDFTRRPTESWGKQTKITSPTVLPGHLKVPHVRFLPYGTHPNFLAPFV